MVYHVGSPLMLEGNRFLPLTGIPILNRERINVWFAVWLPEPFLVATIIEKSFTIWPRAPVCSATLCKSTTIGCSLHGMRVLIP